MDLKSGSPYFFLKNGLRCDFQHLQHDLTTEVVVLGSGITGALMAFQIAKKGIPCCVIDKRKVGLGSTSASTCLLQYEIDVPLHQLIKKIGKENATAAYQLCASAIDKIRDIAQEIGYDGFSECKSLYFSHASKKKDTFLEKEFQSRREAGFEMEYLLEEQISKAFHLRSGAAILSQKAAKIDSYLFTHLLHAHNMKKGVEVFEYTNVVKVDTQEDGVELFTEKGFRIKAGKIIYATGYEVTEQISKDIVDLKSTFALVTEPVEALPAFFKDHLFWNTDDPYLYIREDNNRLIIGGRDENHYNPEKRERLLEKKTKQLQDDFKKLFPEIPVTTQFSWAGTFGSTKDGLPYMGIYPRKPNSYFALGFGGNGITFSALAAAFIAESIHENVDAIPAMFAFNR